MEDSWDFRQAWWKKASMKLVTSSIKYCYFVLEDKENKYLSRSVNIWDELVGGQTLQERIIIPILLPQ